MSKDIKQLLQIKSIIFLTIILCFSYSPKIYAEIVGTQNVLILNSYHKGLSWTDEQTEGITSILKGSKIKCSISIEYMDWKNYPTAENLNNLYKSLKYKYSGKHLDLIITTDDAALEFALKNRKEIFSDAPVVFCGVNEKGTDEFVQGIQNATGVLENVDPERTVKAALEINPNIKKIYVLFDNTESGLSTGKLTVDTINNINPRIQTITLNDKNLKATLVELHQATNDSIVLITTYYSDIDGQSVGFEDFCQLVRKNSNVPIYDLYDFGMGNGAIGGSMLSGRLQGESAGKIALRILNGTNISQIPINKSKTTGYIFDYSILKEFHIPLSRVPAGSEIINRPFSFVRTYKNLVITVSIIFILLVIFIVVLIHYLRKISKMKKELYDNNYELTQLYEELTASEEELKQQLSELIELQQNLELSEERYRILFEKMLNGFIVFEPVLNNKGEFIDVRFVNMNPAVKKHFSYGIDDFIGKTWTEIMGYENRALGKYREILKSGEAAHFEIYYPEQDCYYLDNAFKVDEKHIGVVFDNITEYKNAIEEVQKLNEELEKRVAQRTSELQNVVQELEAFTYTVSHDLKSPLRAIDGYSRILMEDFGEQFEAEAVEIVSNITNICNDTIDMINKLLKYASTSRAPISKEEIDLNAVFLETFDELKPAYKDRTINFSIENDLPNVSADRILLKQVINNLLSNAIKFTKYKDKTIITVSSEARENYYLIIVRDNGAGFDMEYSGKLFGLFQRLHTSDEFEGSGIGLTTVRKIIQKHGGRTWIEGKANEGAAAYFTLPYGE